MFEGQWGCSRECLEAMARTTVRRELGEVVASKGEETHRHRIPLGLVLLAQGWITQEQLQRALELQRRAGRGRIGEWLTETCGLEESRVTRGLGIQWGCPVLSMEGFDPRAMALAAPRLLVEETGMLPLALEGRTLFMAFAGRPDWTMALAIKHMSGLRVETGLVDEASWKDASEQLGACEGVAAEFEQVDALERLPGRVAAAVNRMQPRASRLVRVREFYWLRMWLEAGAMQRGEGGMPRTREDVADRLYVVGTKQ